MANEAHLLLSAIGGYTDAGLANESWQVGIRLAMVFGTVDPVGTLPNNWAPRPATINRTETNWTITGNWNVGVGSEQFNPDDYLNDQAAPAFTTWMGAVGLANQVTLRELKLFPIGAPLGHAIPAPPYAQGSPCLLTWTANAPHGAGGLTMLPLQIAAVASHRTSQIGRRGRGRIFLPGLSASASNGGGFLQSTFVTSVLNGQVALLEALKYDGLPQSTLSIRPVVTGKPFTNYAIINRVQVDNVPDTQRRRRRSLPLTVSGADVTY